jgi:hypothetical protein
MLFQIQKVQVTLDKTTGNGSEDGGVGEVREGASFSWTRDRREVISEYQENKEALHTLIN